MSGNRTPIVLVAGFLAFASVEPVRAAEVTHVLSARNLKDRDVDISIDWRHEETQGTIRREYVQSTGPLLVNDLTYNHSRDSMRLRGEVGVVHDLSFFLSGSLVIADRRGLDFDRGGDCAATPCVETLLRDGFLPGTQGSSWGIDSETGKQFQSPSNQVFSGPKRSGFEYLGMGLRWAAMNQARDTMKPTWTVGIESRFSVAQDQRFNPAQPTANRGVGLGYHQFILSTEFSRKFGDIEPYMGGWFMQPMRTSSSVYNNQGTGSFAGPQRRMGGEMGLEDTLWNDPARHARIALEAVGRLEYRFEGLAQSELWEVLSGDPRCATQSTYCRSGIDVDATGKAAPNSGVVRSPGYGLVGGDAGISGHIGAHARLRGLFGMSVEQSHFLTDGSTGNSVYDIPGRRFRAEGIYSWRVLIDLTTTFATF